MGGTVGTTAVAGAVAASEGDGAAVGGTVGAGVVVGTGAVVAVGLFATCGTAQPASSAASTNIEKVRCMKNLLSSPERTISPALYLTKRRRAVVYWRL